MATIEPENGHTLPLATGPTCGTHMTFVSNGAHNRLKIPLLTLVTTMLDCAKPREPKFR